MYINGKINTDPSNILQKLECFYCKLHASGHNVPGIDQKRSSFLGDLNVPKLFEEQEIKCEGKISSKGYFDLLESFHNNKTPGNDGIPIEFYKTFLISDSFIRCANECFEKGEMSCTQKQAVITLIEKKKKKKERNAHLLKIGVRFLLSMLTQKSCPK